MPSKSKEIGARWERELAEKLGEQAEYAKKIPGSGALGTILKEAQLTADVVAKYKFFQKLFKIEAKYGYGGEKQMTVYREWMEKVRMQSRDNSYIPAVAIKFRGVMSGDRESAKWICFSIEDWNDMMKFLNELFSDMEDYWEYKYAKLSEKPDKKVHRVS